MNNYQEQVAIIRNQLDTQISQTEQLRIENGRLYKELQANVENTDKVKAEKSQLENQIAIIRKAHKEQIQEIRDKAKSEIQKCSSHVNEVNN